MYTTRILLSALTTLLSTSSLAAPLPAQASPAASSSTSTLSNWIVFSLREQPYQESSLSFTFYDPNSSYETTCSTSLPMDGYVTCSDDKTSFIYGGQSYQYGETWLAVVREDVLDCPAGVANATEIETRKRKREDAWQNFETDEEPPAEDEDEWKCAKRSAQGTLNLKGGFWQQPGWNSWVHPEMLDFVWDWTS